MRRGFKFAVALSTVSAAFAVGASGAVASTGGWKPFGSPSVSGASGPFLDSGIGPLPLAPTSSAIGDGGAYLSDGLTPAQGGANGFFMKGDEIYNGSNTTTVVDVTLPPGETVHTDPECGGPGNPANLCVGGGGYCAPDSSRLVSVSGNEIAFRFACSPGESFEWEAELDSLIPTLGTYDASVQFKVGVYRRTKGGNMWQIKLPGFFEVIPAP